MKRILILVLLYLFGTENACAQVTHSISFQIGLNQTLYWSQFKDSKSYFSHFIPSFAIDYAKFSDNLFWGGIGYGLSPRKTTFYKYPSDLKFGIQYPEFWFRVRTGLKLQRDYLTHLPHIGLGIAVNGNVVYFSSNDGQEQGSWLHPMDTIVKPQRFRPFIELSNTLLNSTFRESKRNVLLTFGIRYYPLNLFNKSIFYEVDLGEYKTIQYKIVEVFLSAGLQRNLHR